MLEKWKCATGISSLNTSFTNNRSGLDATSDSGTSIGGHEENMLGGLPKIRLGGNGDAGKMEMRDGHLVLKYVLCQQSVWPGCHFRQRYLIRGARGKYARPITINSSGREWRCWKNGNAQRAFSP